MNNLKSVKPIEVTPGPEPKLVCKVKDQETIHGKKRRNCLFTLKPTADQDPAFKKKDYKVKYTEMDASGTERVVEKPLLDAMPSGKADLRMKVGTKFEIIHTASNKVVYSYAIK